MKAKQLLHSQNLLGEGPLWHPDENVLYWVDILGKTINRLDPKNGKRQTFSVDSRVGVIAMREKGGFVTAGSNGFGFWELGQDHINYLENPEEDNPDSRFNDGKVDRQGRFWAGTMTHEGAVSALYRLDVDLSIDTVERNLTISNGIGWSPDNRTMYFVDSLRYVIYQYNFEQENGRVANRRIFVQLSENYGIPDGLTVDRDGFVWCAIYGGAKVTRFNPHGKIVAEVDLPVSQPTSCAFGGDGYSDLFITSARSGLSEKALEGQPKAGDLFVVKTDVQGLPEPKFKG